MIFQITPVAEATITTLMNSVSKVIINPLIILLFALAIVYFMYGIARYLLSPDNEEIRKTSKQQMIWGVFGMFIMVAVFGILQLTYKTLGETRIKIDNGSYTVGKLN